MLQSAYQFLSDQWLIAALFWPAILTGLAMAIAGGSVGVVVLLRREALLALALPQVVMLGTAAGLQYLNVDPPTSPVLHWLYEHSGWPTLPAAVAAVICTLLLAALAGRRAANAAGPAARAGNLLLPSLYVAAICGAILIVNASGNHLVEIQRRFVGIDVAVEEHLAEVSSVALLLLGLTTAVLWRRWLLISQAPAAAQVAGLRVGRWDALFLSLLSGVILIGTNALGGTLVTALLFLPAATVLPWAKRVPGAIVVSIALSIAFFATGFLLSNAMAWPLTHSVGAIGAVTFLLSYLSAVVRR